MSGLSVGVDEDVGIAMVGGDTFEERLKQLAAAKQSLAQAYTDLGVGKSAKLVAEEASKQKDEAERLMARATREYEEKLRLAKEDAERNREAILADAKSKADEMLKAAADDASKAAAERETAAAMSADVAKQLDAARADVNEAAALVDAADKHSKELDVLRVALHAEQQKVSAVGERLLSIINEVAQLQKEVSL